MNNEYKSNLTGMEIAVIGMSGRFSKSSNIDEFWENLKNGKELITFFTDEELLEAGVDSGLLKQENYVKARGILEGVELFDPYFFNYLPADARVMDPQMRIFLECAYEALENSGYAPDAYRGLVGVYSGASHNFYWEGQSLFAGVNEKSLTDIFQSYQLFDRDFLSTQIAYKLNLKGPAFNVQTACSTALVATHLACQALLSGEVDIALAGGVSVTLPQKAGYVYQPDMILSPDGHCRAFDSKAAGTIEGNGVGIVVLKRLEEAMADGDNIYAVIKGSAIINDGDRKAGFTAPSYEGQVDVLLSAQRAAEVDPESICYVEAHGAGTALGDPVEFRALKTAFKSSRKNFCGLGSVKSNIGHLDAAAGIAGLIKSILVLYNRVIPPTLHFESPNPEIGLEDSPFYIANELKVLERGEYPLRAAVSAFGIGGTNSHLILEEAPPRDASSIPEEWNLLPLSAKTKGALNRMSENLKDYLEADKTGNLSDIAFTLQLGRNAYKERRIVIAGSHDEAIRALSDLEPPGVYSFSCTENDNKFIFMFPGQSSQYIDMGLGLYEKEPVFRRELDKCFSLLNSITGIDFLDVLYPTGDRDEAGDRIFKNECSQPLIFSFEYALAKTLMAWGIEPYAMIGYSFGEYTAACLAGVFSLRDGLTLVSERGRLMGQLPAGAMLSIPLAEDKLRPLLPENISIAVVNGPSCIVAGLQEDIEAFEKIMKSKRYLCMRVAVRHAAHCCGMDEIASEFFDRLKGITLEAPRIPYISNITGDWISVEQAASPEYWVRHLKETVRFSDGIKELLKEEGTVFMEVGPGTDLLVLIQKHFDNNERHRLINFIRHPSKEVPDMAFFLDKVARIWTVGGNINWNVRYGEEEKRKRVPLPTYPFDRRKFWLEEKEFSASTGRENPLVRKEDIFQCLFTPQWKRTELPADKKQEAACILLMLNDDSFDEILKNELLERKHTVVTVSRGSGFVKRDTFSYVIDRSEPEDLVRLFHELAEDKLQFDVIIDLFYFGNHDDLENAGTHELCGVMDNLLDNGIHFLNNIAKTVSKSFITDRNIRVYSITDGMHNVLGTENIMPYKSTVLGPVKVIPLEFSNIFCSNIDIPLPENRQQQVKAAMAVVNEVGSEKVTEVVCYRGNYRWIQVNDKVEWDGRTGVKQLFREKGVYFISGGFGGIGLTIARDLAEKYQPVLILAGRTAVPERSQWGMWLQNHDENDSLSVKIRKIKELEELGAEVLVVKADIANAGDMEAVGKLISDRYPMVNGIIHAAGIADGAMIQLRNKEDTRKILLSKVHGTLILDKVFEKYSPDFFISFSSISSVLADMGQVGYCAANSFLDAFTNYKRNRGMDNYYSVNWDVWKEVGMGVNSSGDFTVNSSGYAEQFGMTPAEGLQVFNGLLERGYPRLIVSTTEFNPLVMQLLEKQVIMNLNDCQDTPVSEFSPRSEYLGKYVAPVEPMEKKLVEIMQNFFAIEKIGIEDDFFELGANSLKAIQLTNVLDRAGIEVTLKDFFMYRTVRTLSEYLDTKDIGSAEAPMAENIEPSEHKAGKKKAYQMSMVSRPR